MGEFSKPGQDYENWKSLGFEKETSEYLQAYTPEERAIISGMDEDSRLLFLEHMTPEERKGELASRKEAREQLNSPDWQVIDRAPELLGVSPDRATQLIASYRRLGADYNVRNVTPKIAELLTGLESQLAVAETQEEKQLIRNKFITEFGREDVTGA